MIELAREVIAMIVGIFTIGAAIMGYVRVKSNQIKHSVKMETISANKIQELCDDVTKLKQDSIAGDALHHTLSETLNDKADKTALADLKYKVATLEGKFEQHNWEGANNK